MKNRRLQFEYRSNASKLHRAVGDCLRDSEIFASHKIYQEYPVTKINSFYPGCLEHYDWVILDLHVVIECHGQQHYKPVDFSGSDPAEAELNFKSQQKRDISKEEAAIDAGFIYIVVPYTDVKKISETYLLELVRESEKNSGERKPVLRRSPRNPTGPVWKEQYRKQKEWLEESGIARERKERAREQRKEQYQRAKEYRKQKQAEQDAIDIKST